MASARPPKGLRITFDEMVRFGAPSEVGELFTTDMLDIRPGVFEVIEIDEKGAVVSLVAYLRWDEWPESD